MNNIYGFEPDEDELTHIQEHLRYLAFPVEKLNQDPENARSHPEKNFQEVKQSIEEYQVREALKVRKETLVIEAGNLRHRVIQDLGFDWAPVLLCDDDEEKATKFALADNRTGELGVWNQDVVVDQLNRASEDWDGLEGTGFTKEDHEVIQNSFDENMDWGSGLDDDDEDVNLTDEDEKRGKVTVTCRPEDLRSVRNQIEVAIGSFEDVEIE